MVVRNYSDEMIRCILQEESLLKNNSSLKSVYSCVCFSLVRWTKQARSGWFTPTSELPNHSRSDAASPPWCGDDIVQLRCLGDTRSS